MSVWNSLKLSLLDIDLGAAFEPSITSSNSGYSEGGFGTEGGLSGGGGYTGSNPSNYEKPAQEATFDRGTSLNMDPFAGEGRFSSNTGSDFSSSSMKKNEKGSSSLNIKNSTPKVRPIKTNINRTSTLTSASSSTPSSLSDDETFSGEVENKIKESSMIDSEDNYNSGFDFVVGNENDEDDIPTINGINVEQTSSLNNSFSDDDDDSVFVGDVEDKASVNESHMIGNDDDDDEGFNFM